MPRFPAIVLSFALACASASAVAQTPLVVPKQAPATQQGSEGDRFLVEVLATLQRRASVSARLRHQARLYDDTVMGSGKYWQLGVGNQRRTRWEMQSQVSDTTASYVQVFDGEHLWTDRTLPSGRRVLRLDVGRLQALRRTSRLTAKRQALPWTSMLAHAEGQGGLAEMVADLLRRYTFAPRRKTQLNGLAAYAMVGHWRPNQLHSQWPQLAEGADVSQWPGQLPHHVLVLVGQSNLFPYVIEQRRFTDAPLAQSAAGVLPTKDPLVRYEVFEVQFAAALKESLFEYRPGDVQWSDETALVFELMEARRQ